MINRENYIVIQGWMITDLKLTGKELILYALIYGFSQVKEQRFNGSLAYMEEWLGTTRPTVIKTLQELINKNLIKKYKHLKNNIQFCEYEIVPLSSSKEILLPVKNFNQGSKEILPGVVKFLNRGSKEILHNIHDDNTNNISLSHDNNVSFEEDIEREKIEFHKFLKKQYKVENPQAYISTVKRNGDYPSLLKEYGEYKAKLQEKNPKKDIKSDLLKVTDKYSAAIFIGNYGDPFIEHNHPKEVLDVIEKYGFGDWDEIVEYLYKERRKRAVNG